MIIEHYAGQTRRYDTFQGRVYDGPLQGQMHTELGRDWFHVVVHSEPRFTGVDSLTASQNISVRHGRYLWSEPLWAWVFDWRTVANQR